jgi:hypothetical protein
MVGGKNKAAATVCDRPLVLLEVLYDGAPMKAGRTNRSPR